MRALTLLAGIFCLFAAPVRAEAITLVDTTPIHIGDNEGSMDDVVAYKKARPTKYSGYAHKWEFISPAAGDAEIQIAIISLDDSQYDCPTVIKLNDGRWIDLRKHADKYGEGVLSQVRIPVKVLAGKNLLTATSDACTWAGSHYNDAVFESLRIDVK